MMHLLDPLISPRRFLLAAWHAVTVHILRRRIYAADPVDRRLVLWSWQLDLARRALRQTWRHLRRGT